MELHQINPTDRLEFPRESVIVAIPVFGALDEFTQCIHSVLKHTSTDVPVLVADDGSPDPGIRQLLEDIDRSGAQEHVVYYLRQPTNIGFVGNMNSVFEIAGQADVVVLNSDCVVADGWLESLRKAACSDSQVATASTLTNNGTILSVPHRNRPFPVFPQDWSFEKAAEVVRATAPNLNSQIPTGIGHCLYIRRFALDVVGDFDEAFSPGYGEEVDFCQRCVLAGLEHVVADDVLVLHHGSGSFGKDAECKSLKAKHDAIVSNRYPYYDQWVQKVAEDSTSTLARSINAASIALGGMSVTIDGRCLSTYVTGTSMFTLNLIGALARVSGARLRVLVPMNIDGEAEVALSKLPVEFLQVGAVDDKTERSHVVHRPYQLAQLDDIELLEKLGDRLVLTQLDMIAYRNPSYHESFEDWWNYRQLMRTGFMLADRVAFISRHGARTAVVEELLDPERAAVVYPGTDHEPARAEEELRKPGGLEEMDSRQFLLCMGTDFKHKNRRFALRLLEALRDRQGWEGSIVFAGAHVLNGSSAGEEAEYLATRPDIDAHVVDLASVGSAEKAWLYKEAAAFVYPSLYEGFGFLPFEAAQAGTPCLFALQSSLEELLPSRLALLTKWDAEESADRAIEVLTDTDEKRDHLEGLRAAAAMHSWDRTGSQMCDLYKSSLSSPARDGGELRAEFTRQWTLIGPQLAELRRRTHLDSFDEIDEALVGHDGVLPEDLRRALLAAWNRRWSRAVFFWPIMMLYRLTYLLKHGTSSRKKFNKGSES